MRCDTIGQANSVQKRTRYGADGGYIQILRSRETTELLQVDSVGGRPFVDYSTLDGPYT